MNGKYFAERLKELIDLSELKNAQIAQALGYDISYISKWTSGKSLPAAKGIEQTIRLLSKIVSENISEPALKIVLHKYNASNISELVSIFCTILENAYLQDINARNKSNEFGVRIDYYNVLISQEEAINKVNDYFDRSDEIFSLIDITCLERETLLTLLGIKDGSLYSEKSIGTSNAEVTFILYLKRTNTEKQIYSFITLMHFICAFSHKGIINIYLDDCAARKFVFVDSKEGKFLNAGLLKNSSNCMPFFIRSDKRDALLARKEFSAIIRRSQPALRLYSSNDIIKKKDYLKVIISSDPKWLVGHITELFLTIGDLENLRSRLKIDENEYKNICLMHQFISDVYIKNNVRMLFYETAISDFVLYGEADIYNNHITMTIAERIKILENILYFVGCKNIDIKWIAGGFFDEYKHVPNPCIFSSNIGSFIRIENGLEKNNIYSVLSQSLRDIVDDCFEEMWYEHNEIVKDNPKYISDCLCTYIENCKSLENIQQQ